MPILSGQTLNKVTKALLAPVRPFQVFLDAPSPTHVHCLQQAYNVLGKDGREDVVTYFRPYDDWLTKGLFWADQGWKNICHYFFDPQKQGRLHWPGADAECQYYFNKAIAMCHQNVPKGMFYLGAALHLVQDMCVPHHALGVVFDGHQEFERWTSNNLQYFTAKQNGIYKPFTHPSQWIRYNVEKAALFYPLVSQEKGCSEENYYVAAGELLPLTVYTTAGFLVFSKHFLQRAKLTA
ncbi:zinc dependent phospholipase C family protein [Desulfosporosinus sp. SB140]|uniref:zinc dependent phospholipase C family protein n=1 Tax=Desulfosporosinus paludis TaxID=3115649 RepID=UPI00388FF4C8